MKVLKRQLKDESLKASAFCIGRLEEFQFLKEAQSLKMKVLKRQRFFIIGRLGELSFI